MQVENLSASSFNTAMQATGYGNHTAMPTHWNNNVQYFLIKSLMYNGRLENKKKRKKTGFTKGDHHKVGDYSLPVNATKEYSCLPATQHSRE